MSLNLQDLAKNMNLSLEGMLSALLTLAVCLVVTKVALKLVRRLLERSKLDQRIRDLNILYRETRETALVLERYYDRRYHGHGRRAV